MSRKGISLRGRVPRLSALPRRHGLIEQALWWGAAIVGGAMLARTIVSEPLLSAGGLGLLLFVLVTWRRRESRLPLIFLKALGIVLVGYALFGRGFAHIGFGGFLYVGEIVLGLGLLAVVLGGGIGPALRSPIIYFLAAYMIWGALQTVPYLDDYGLDALRDAVTWGYAVFAFLVAGFVLRLRMFPKIVLAYGRFLPWVLLAVPMQIVLDRMMGVALFVPGFSDLNLLTSRSGPLLVHMAGAGTFLLVGLHRVGRERQVIPLGLKEWIWWTLWLVGAGMAAVLNRGGMLAVTMALMTVFLLRPSSRWGKMLLSGALLTTVFVVFNIGTASVKSQRTFSPQQLITNYVSVFGDDTQQHLADTREWRLRWWRKIVDYTVFGDYFWTGKGFGINLLVSDAPTREVDPDVDLRSPHNGHMTILARMGVPGFFLWLLLQSVFGAHMLRAYLRARSIGDEWWARINLWVLSFWIAFLVNMSFGVFLEGPYGGIWFWTVIGIGIAALESQKASDRPTRRRWTSRPATYPPLNDRYVASRVS